MADLDDIEMRAVRVQHTARIAEDIQLFEFVDPNGADLPEFSAGAHILVQAPNGIIRRYSLSNDPNELESLHNTASTQLKRRLASRLDALESCAAQSCSSAEN